VDCSERFLISDSYRFHSARLIGLCCVIVVSLLLCGARARRPKRNLGPPPVTPSVELESRVQDEIRKASNIIANLDEDRLFDSPYVASAVFYHGGFLSSYPVEKEDADPARRIIGAVNRALTAPLKMRYLDLIDHRYSAALGQIGPSRVCAPVSWERPKKRKRRRRTHPYAIDIFTPEGSTVRAAAAGVVIVAESGWTEADPFSTSSRLGGNTVIVVNPVIHRMYRYCHLESVLVSAGELLRSGQTIGRVGHSGINASRPRHGGHLHFEVNEYDVAGVHALDFNGLVSLLNSASSAESARLSDGLQ
jgi:murein DD-endopeptidase MepM/ murein hydrolase activator NlpD